MSVVSTSANGLFIHSRSSGRRAHRVAARGGATARRDFGGPLRVALREPAFEVFELAVAFVLLDLPPALFFRALLGDVAADEVGEGDLVRLRVVDKESPGCAPPRFFSRAARPPRRTERCSSGPCAPSDGCARGWCPRVGAGAACSLAGAAPDYRPGLARAR
jgi:hypothetical protein